MFSIEENANGRFYVFCKNAPLIFEIDGPSTATKLSSLDQTSPEIGDRFYDILGIELPVRQSEGKAKMPFRFLEAIVTYDCNFACSYCWQKSAGFNKQEKMSLSVFRKVIEIVADYNKEFNFEGVYRIGFMGGEPLLMSDFILEAHDMANELLGTSEGAILTNGTFLTEEYCEKLAKRRMSICVSLDGPPEVNYRRDSFTETWSGVQNALRYNVPLSVQSTLSGRQIEQGAMGQTARFFLENGLTDFVILLESPIDRTDDRLLYDAYKYLLLLLVASAEQTKKLPSMLKSFIHNITNDNYPLSDCFCRFLYPAGIQFDPGGDVFACEFDRDKNRYGNVVEGSAILHHAAKRLGGVNKHNDPMCRQCSYLGICYGYPRLCSLYRREEKCHMKIFYRACFDVLPDWLDEHWNTTSNENGRD